MTVLWNCRLLDGSGGSARENSTVTIVHGFVDQVESATGDMPAGAIDLGGRTLLPGLIDAHCHVLSDVSRAPAFGPRPELHGEDPRPRELGHYVLAKSAQAYLEAGITTVRDVGSMDDEAIALRTAIDLDVIAGPRVLSCGRIISATSPGGRIFGTMYREADGEGELRKAVREQFRRGADFVKLMSTGARSVAREDPEPAQLTREEIRVVIDEAHRMGYRVAAHAEGLEGTRIAIEEGVDTVEHGLALHRSPELLASMAERGIVLVPTLTTFHDLAERFADHFPAVLVEQAKRQLDEAYATVVAARIAGVTIAMGYDSGPPGTSATELVRLVDAGLSTSEGIAAATSGGAAAIGDPNLGVVRAGAHADMLVVDGDPLDEPRLLLDPARIWLVLRDGKAVAGRALDGSGAAWDARRRPEWGEGPFGSPCLVSDG